MQFFPVPQNARAFSAVKIGDQTIRVSPGFLRYPSLAFVFQELSPVSVQQLQTMKMKETLQKTDRQVAPVVVTGPKTWGDTLDVRAQKEVVPTSGLWLIGSSQEPEAQEAALVALGATPVADMDAVLHSYAHVMDAANASSM